MSSGTFSHDPHSHAIVVASSAPSSIARGVRVRTSMCTIRHDPELVLITDLQVKNGIKINISDGLCFSSVIGAWLDDVSFYLLIRFVTAMILVSDFFV